MGRRPNPNLAPLILESELGDSIAATLDLTSVDVAPDAKSGPLIRMDLSFDAFSDKASVTPITERIRNLGLVHQELHRPPTVTISWGSLLFTGVIEAFAVSFTMFLPDGTPVRAVVALEFRSFESVPTDCHGTPRR